MYKSQKENNAGLMKLEKHLSKDKKQANASLNNIIQTAKGILEENHTMIYTKQHPIFSYIKIFTDYIQNYQAMIILKNGRDNISFRKNKYFNTVSSYYHSIDHILFENLLAESKYYKIDDLYISNARDPILTKIWKKSSIVDTIKNIGNGMMNKHFYNNDVERENVFEFDKVNHMAQYFYPLGITYVYNGNHSIFSGMNKGEGNIKVNTLFDVSYLYEYFYFDGIYLKNGKTQEKHKIYFEIGVLFEIGRLLLEHPEVFENEIQKKINTKE